jgi:hypothetical protein
MLDCSMALNQNSRDPIEVQVQLHEDLIHQYLMQYYHNQIDLMQYFCLVLTSVGAS